MTSVVLCAGGGAKGAAEEGRSVVLQEPLRQGAQVCVLFCVCVVIAFASCLFDVAVVVRLFVCEAGFERLIVRFSIVRLYRHLVLLLSLTLLPVD